MKEDLEYFKQRILEDYPGLPKDNVNSRAMSLIKKRYYKLKDEWIPHKGISSSLRKEEFYNLMKTKNSLPIKPDQTKVSKAAKDMFGRFEHTALITAKAEIIDEANTPEKFIESMNMAMEDLKNDKPSDYILLKSVLCTSLPFVNENNDAFDPQGMVDAVESGQMDKFMPAIVDWNHNFESVGNTVGAEIIDKEIEIDGLGKQKVKQIIVYSVFYSWLFPHKAKKVRQWADAKILTFSMACGADEVEYINGNTRVLKGPHFVANSIITPESDPADKHAVIETVAIDKNEEGEEMNEELKKLKTEIANLKDLIASGNSKDIASLVESLSGKIFNKATEYSKDLDTLQLKVESMEKELKAAKEQVEKIESKYNDANDSLVASEQSVESFRDDLAVKVEALKELRQTEIDRVNGERKEKLSLLIEDEEVLNSWAENTKSSISDDGEIIDNQESFDNVVKLLGAKKEDLAAIATNADDSDLTKESKEAGKIISATVKDGKGQEYKSM